MACGRRAHDRRRCERIRAACRFWHGASACSRESRGFSSRGCSNRRLACESSGRLQQQQQGPAGAAAARAGRADDGSTGRRPANARGWPACSRTSTFRAADAGGPRQLSRSQQQQHRRCQWRRCARRRDSRASRASVASHTGRTRLRASAGLSCARCVGYTFWRRGSSSEWRPARRSAAKRDRSQRRNGLRHAGPPSRGAGGSKDADSKRVVGACHQRRPACIPGGGFVGSLQRRTVAGPAGVSPRERRQAAGEREASPADVRS